MTTQDPTPNRTGTTSGPLDRDEMKMTAVPDMERRMVSFTPGTQISTRNGFVSVEDLAVGDEVITRERGYQPIRWIGSCTLTAAELRQNPQLQPVLVRKGAIGKDHPLRDTLLSPNQRVLLAKTTDQPEDAPEGLVAISALVDLDGIDRVAASDVTYVHLVFDRHPVVLGDGLWSDSLQPGNSKAVPIKSAGAGTVVDLFPELTPSRIDSETIFAQAAAEKEYARHLSAQQHG
ncbi:Hint domain-containing protein [Pseudosulfitobacter sp. DSM 107133]|uniref:Hint domain-containing protein n=1 Tax=Pseudosulfitobacter sp. DSM 107133 TaxID=2883100 RepID=UPI000DF468F8|nr:Hint domain-containing protein [Pseudosulfitobacter sp. DSM 107133]UOA28329.1 hypothetical protein DSM107133_03075 [Pseudosulfitobacter sp. DSM 107133]